MMKILDGYRGESHITAAMVAAQNIGLFGEDLHILNVGKGMSIEKTGANSARVNDGAFVYQGVRGVVEAGSFEEIVFDEGEIGKKRIDVLAIRYEKDMSTNIESLSFEIKKGTAVLSSATPTEPSLTTGNIQNGAVVSEVKFCVATFNETAMTLSGIGKLKSIPEVVGDISSINTFIKGAQTKTEGCYQLPDGVLVQWGTVNNISVPKTGVVTMTVNFKRTFTTTPLVICNPMGNYNIAANPAHNTWKASFPMNVRSLDGIARTGRSVNWLAIGY